MWFFGKAAVLLFVLCAGVVGVPPRACADSTEGTEVRFLCPEKKVIPVYCRIGDWEISDVKLPELVLTNTQQTTLTVERVDAVASGAGHEILSLRLNASELAEAVGRIAAWFNAPDTQPSMIRLSFGDARLPEGKLASSLALLPGESVVLPLSKMAYLHHVGQQRIDAMEIRLMLRAEGSEEKNTILFPVPLLPYKAKGAYIFPLRGDLRVAFTPLSYIHHRAAGSQEFGMDIVAARQEGAPSFTDISLPQPKTLSDYGIWGRDVLAIGGGVVVETGTKFPEGSMSDPAEYSKPGYTRNLLLELVPKIGWTNAVAGNYVIIDHENGEFSAYCHLQEGSVGVKEGDRVLQGDVIGRVGNTGNSGAPHLHFQLMDSKDFFTANGLPVMFENVSTDGIVTGYPVEANCLGFSDSLYFTVP